MIVKDTSAGGGDFKILDPGVYAAVCTQIVGIGPQESTYQGQTSEKDKIKIRFEVPGERVEWTDADGVTTDGPMVIWGTYTASLAERAKLRAHLESWRGKKFSAEELKGFQLDKVLGAPCMITVKHNDGGDRTYANIEAIGPLMKGIDKPVAEGDLVSFDFYDHTADELAALPEWLQDRIADAMSRFTTAAPAQPEPEPEPADEGFADDDIPF